MEKSRDFRTAIIFLQRSPIWRWIYSKVKGYLVSPLVCPKCRGPMKIVSFLENQTVVRQILQHLGLWETQQRPPPKKIVSSLPPEPMEEDYLPWVADPVLLV